MAQDDSAVSNLVVAASLNGGSRAAVLGIQAAAKDTTADAGRQQQQICRPEPRWASPEYRRARIGELRQLGGDYIEHGPAVGGEGRRAGTELLKVQRLEELAQRAAEGKRQEAAMRNALAQAA